MAQHAEPPEREITLEAWAGLDEEDRRELVDGILVEEEMPTTVHELIVAWVIEVLRVWARSRGGLVLGSGVKLAVAPGRGRMPDAMVYLRGKRRPPVQGLVDVPPSVAIEVVTATPRDERRDRVEKLREYAAFGIQWYWLVDPEMRTFEVLELGNDGRYVHAVAVSEGVVENVPGCEGLLVDVDGLWAEVEALVNAGRGEA
jgi:Uma2 family endonuclease